MRTLQLLPTLNPAQCLHTSPPGPLPFPLAYPRTRMYYFARNGVWESVDALGLHAGDEVLMPSYCSGLEVEALEARGVVPVFYRLNERLEPDLNDAADKITDRTKVFYCIHYFGFPQPLEEIQKFCTRTHLLFFEDNALGFLSADADGKPLGSTGDAALFCPRKTLPLPHGGMLVVNNPSLPMPSAIQEPPSAYSTLGETFSLVVRDIMRNPGWRGNAARTIRTRVAPSLKNFFSHTGLTHTASGGGTFDTATALWGMARFARKFYSTFDYAEIVAKRRAHYQRLTERLSPLHGNALTLAFPELGPYTCPLEFLILVDNLERTSCQLAKRGIECGRHWWWARPRKIASQFPNLKPLTDRALLLPIHQDLSEEDIDYMASTLTNILKNGSISSS